MSVNTSCSILHFLKHDITDKANNLGISLGSNDKETTKSINDILDLEKDRVVDLIRHLAAVKPMNEADINDLGVTALQSLYEDLVPMEGLETEEEKPKRHADNVAHARRTSCATNAGPEGHKEIIS